MGTFVVLGLMVLIVPVLTGVIGGLCLAAVSRACPSCHSLMDKTAAVCAACGRESAHA